MMALAKRHPDIGEWIQSAVNHIHWIAQTSTDNEEVNEAKLRSFMNHIADIHEGHGQAYPECLHDMPLVPDRKKYLTKGIIVTSKRTAKILLLLYH